MYSVLDCSLVGAKRERRGAFPVIPSKNATHLGSVHTLYNSRTYVQLMWTRYGLCTVEQGNKGIGKEQIQRNWRGEDSADP